MSFALLLLNLAVATVPDTYGAGARSMGMGGGGIAMTADPSAAQINPAGLYEIRHPILAVGAAGVIPTMKDIPDLWWDTNRDGTVDENDPPLQYSAQVDNSVGGFGGIGRPLGPRFAMGASFYIPAQRLLRFSTVEPALPNYFMYDNRTQRYAVSAGLAAQIVPGLNVGAGVEIVPSAKLDLALTIDAQVVGSGTEGEELSDLVGDVTVDVHELNADVVPGVAPTAGLQFHLGEYVPAVKGLWFGASFRGSVALPIDVRLDLQANISAEDIGDLEPIVIAALLDTGLTLTDHYVPLRVGMGAAYRPGKILNAYADLYWTNWRPMTLNVARLTSVNVTAPLVELDDAIVDGNPYDVTLTPVWSVRTGSEFLLPTVNLKNKFKYLKTAVRVGFQYEPSPLLTQGTTSAFLDTDRLGFTAGAGVEFWDPLHLFNGPMHIDVFGQFHLLASGTLPRSADTPTAGYPVAASGIPIGGTIAAFGGQWTFEY